MNLSKHAKTELELIGAFSEEDDFYGGMTGKAVMELIEVFSKLANYKPLQPITGKDEEWAKLDYEDGLTYQNLRESGLFKHADGRVTYVDALIKRSPDGTCWSGPIYMTREDAINDRNRFSGSLEILGFPFTPKTFYIDVIEEEIKPDDWIIWVKDPAQLDQVWEYYKKPDFI